MKSLENLRESMGCNTIRDDHGGGIIYQRVHMDKAEFDEMLAEVEEEYSDLQVENSKLRELVCDMWNDMNVYHLRHESPDSSDMDFYLERMREIGIEANND